MVLDLGRARTGIDAGLFQGEDARQNRRGFGHNPANLWTAMLIHSHVDHSGRIFLLVKDGFKGPIYLTPATADLCGILPKKDAAYLLEAAAIHESHHLERDNGPPHLPALWRGGYYQADAPFSPAGLWQKAGYHRFSAVFRDAGHILGLALIEFSCHGYGKKYDRKIVFSGDQGRPGPPFLKTTRKVQEADYVVIDAVSGHL
jgi:metallo-beta-lactamase family protein